jgi:hypothetical protein
LALPRTPAAAPPTLSSLTRCVCFPLRTLPCRGLWPALLVALPGRPAARLLHQQPRHVAPESKTVLCQSYGAFGGARGLRAARCTPVDVEGTWVGKALHTGAHWSDCMPAVAQRAAVGAHSPSCLLKRDGARARRSPTAGRAPARWGTSDSGRTARWPRPAAGPTTPSACPAPRGCWRPARPPQSTA